MSPSRSLTALVVFSGALLGAQAQVLTEYLYPSSCFEHATTTGLEIVTITDIVHSTRYHHVICPVCTGIPEMYHNGVPKETTIYETVYTCPGPHGMEPKTYTITEPCPTTGLSRPTDYIPSGFTVTEAQCTGCPGSPYVHVTTPVPQETHKPGRLPPPPPGSNAPRPEYHIPSQEENENGESPGPQEKENEKEGSGQGHGTSSENGGHGGEAPEQNSNIGQTGEMENKANGPTTEHGSPEEGESSGNGQSGPGAQSESGPEGQGQSGPGTEAKSGPEGHGQGSPGGSGEGAAGGAGKGGKAGEGTAAPSGTAAAGGKGGPEIFKGSAQRGLDLQWAVAIVAMTFAIFMI